MTTAWLHQPPKPLPSICSPYPQKPSPDPQIPIGRASRSAEHKRPAVSSPEGCPTPADRVRASRPATADVRQPLTLPEVAMAVKFYKPSSELRLWLFRFLDLGYFHKARKSCIYIAKYYFKVGPCVLPAFVPFSCLRTGCVNNKISNFKIARPCKSPRACKPRPPSITSRGRCTGSFRHLRIAEFNFNQIAHLPRLRL